MAGVHNLNLNYKKALQYYDQGRLVDAMEAFQEALRELEPNSPEAKLAKFYLVEAHSRMAEENMARGSSLKAEKHLKEATKSSPKYPDLHFQLAQILAERGATHEAMVELEAALELNPNYGKALLLLGVLAYKSGEYEAGAGHIKHAIQLDQRYDTPLYKEAITIHQRGDYDRALKKFYELSVTNVDDLAFYLKNGKNQYRTGDYVSAVESFEQAVKLQGNYADIRNWLGLSYMACAKNMEAIEQFNKALEINPCFCGAIINIGVTHEMMGNKDEAKKSYLKALDIDPSNLEARERLGRLYSSLS